MTLEKSSNFVERSQISENKLSIDFNILNKQTINSDGKENLVALKAYELNTAYIYHSVPKLNKGAFLLAKISDWTQYNLTAGKANIFFEGGFVGTSNINPQVTSDSLLISMGLDNSIVQIPVSQNESIEISLEEKGSAAYSPKIEKLLWTMDIDSRQTKKEQFIYTVKHPKKESISWIK